MNELYVWVWIDEYNEYKKLTKKEFSLEKFGQKHNLEEISDLIQYLSSSYVSNDILNIMNQINRVSVYEIMTLTGYSEIGVRASLSKLYGFGIVKKTVMNNDYRQVWWSLKC